jgi:hypothetical protein
MKRSTGDFLTVLEKIEQGYLDIIGQEAFSVLVYLMYIKRAKSRTDISPKELMDRLNFSSDTLKKSMDILKTVELVKINKDDPSNITFQIQLKNNLKTKDKIDLITALSKKDLLDNSRIVFLKDLFTNNDVEKSIKINTIDSKSSDWDLSKVKVRAKAGRDTGEGLVDFYYDNLTNKFNVPSASPHKQRESHMMKTAMKKFGDTPDITRQLLLKMIDKFFRTGEYQKVATLWLYHSERNTLFFDLFGKKQDKFVQEYKPDFEYAKSQAKSIFDYFKSKGEDIDFIFNSRIKPTLSNLTEEELNKIRLSLEEQNG